jgi:hypothetical protein
MEATRVNNGIRFVGGSNETSRQEFAALQCSGPGQLDIDVSTSFNVNVRLVDCVCSITWNGGPAYDNVQVNNLLAQSCVFRSVRIVDGAFHSYDSHGIFTGLTIEDGPLPNSQPFAEIVGGLNQGTTTLTGRAQLYLRGVMNQASFVATASPSGAIPFVQADKPSMPLGGISGPVKLQNDDEYMTNVSASFAVTVETVVIADATSGGLTVTLPKAAACVGRRIVVKKEDGSANAVAVQPQGTDTIDGQSSVSIGAANGGKVVISNGTKWYVIGNF